MKFPLVQYVVGVQQSSGSVAYFWGATRTLALRAAGNPADYRYARFTRGQVLKPNRQPVPHHKTKRSSQKVV